MVSAWQKTGVEIGCEKGSSVPGCDSSTAEVRQLVVALRPVNDLQGEEEVDLAHPPRHR